MFFHSISILIPAGRLKLKHAATFMCIRGTSLNEGSKSPYIRKKTHFSAVCNQKSPDSHLLSSFRRIYNYVVSAILYLLLICC